MVGAAFICDGIISRFSVPIDGLTRRKKADSLSLSTPKLYGSSSTKRYSAILRGTLFPEIKRDSSLLSFSARLRAFSSKLSSSYFFHLLSPPSFMFSDIIEEK